MTGDTEPTAPEGVGSDVNNCSNSGSNKSKQQEAGEEEPTAEQTEPVKGDRHTDEPTLAVPAVKPHEWEPGVVPEKSLRLWTEVGANLDKSQTVVWRAAVESLEQANMYLTQSPDARAFVETYMMAIIGILVDQQPAKIGPTERSCVQESLSFAVTIVARDLAIQLDRGTATSLLNVLACIFNRKKNYYKSSKGNWNASHLSGLPEIRIIMLNKFKRQSGFNHLASYLDAKVGTPDFPALDILHHILSGISDALLDSTRAAMIQQNQQQQQQVQPNSWPNAVPVGSTAQSSNHDSSAVKEWEDQAIRVGDTVMQYIHSCPEDVLKKLANEHITVIQADLKRIFDRLATNRRQATYKFYEFWRAFVHKLITSQSLPLKLFGWTEVDELLEACADHRPPPRSYIVRDAGCTFVDGEYSFAGSVTADGYAQRGTDISYERIIPKEDPKNGGKKLTLFRCTMRSHQKWWFLSEADEEQPGTDRDIDYYQHRSNQEEETEPPMSGWATCRNSGLDPPPKLERQGLMVPAGEEFRTLEHQLAKWAIENGIIELVLGDSVHREIVARSTPLIRFLASMYDRDSHIVPDPDSGTKPNQYCLQTSHLLLAWKTCTKKADAAVSAQVYQLLVTILPECPTSLAVPLLQAIKASLQDSRRDNLNEVAEFCAALAASAGNANNSNSNNPKSNSDYLKPETRAEVLELFWAVFVHPEASSLKTYDSLKSFVTTELGVEPAGRAHREKYLSSCVEALQATAASTALSPVNEIQILRMVKLTNFVLDACPRAHATELVEANGGILADMLFRELTNFLTRKAAANTSGVSETQRKCSADQEGDRHALSQRLRVLRNIYGLSGKIFMSSDQLSELWQKCVSPQDREEVMIFVADASKQVRTPAVASTAAAPAPGTSGRVPNVTECIVYPAFTAEVCNFAFFDLFCSPDMTFESLGSDAYRSFQYMFQMAQSAALSAVIDNEGTPRDALDALWRICLRANNDQVAAQAMSDLLAAYATQQPTLPANNWSGSTAPMSASPVPAAIAPDAMQTETTNVTESSFAKRVFDCLNDVKTGLGAGDTSAELAAERCLRILITAIGEHSTSHASRSLSVVKRLSAVPLTASLDDVFSCIPHGMRGQSQYRRINVTCRRTPVQGQHTQQSSYDQSMPRPQTIKLSLDVHPLETMISVKSKIAAYCKCQIAAVKPVSATGRAAVSAPKSHANEALNSNLGLQRDDAIVDELGIVDGCELIVVVADRPGQPTPTMAQQAASLDMSTDSLSDLFFNKGGDFPDRLFQLLLEVLNELPWRDPDAMSDSSRSPADVHRLVWDLLLAMPTNGVVASRVRVTASGGIITSDDADDAMDVDSKQDQWARLLNLDNFHRSVYVLLAIDANLQPAPEVLSCMPTARQQLLEREMTDNAAVFRRGFIESGGFDAVVSFFSKAGNGQQSKNRMGNAVALRILKCCLFGGSFTSQHQQSAATDKGLDDAGAQLLKTLSNASGLLKSLASMVVGDLGISTSTISDVLKFLRLLFRSEDTARTFVSLPESMAERFLVTLLLWEGPNEVTRSVASMGATQKVRKNTHDLVLLTPLLSDHALPWLIRALSSLRIDSDSTSEYFDVVKQLVGAERTSPRSPSNNELTALSTVVCQKLTCCPRPTKESTLIDHATGVLSGCLALLRALIESGGGNVLRDGTTILVNALGVTRWSILFQPADSRRPEDVVLIDLMGVVFDAFLSPGGSTSVVAICCDQESRQHGFDVVGAAARSCSGGDGYSALVGRISTLIQSAAPHLRHRWGQFGNNDPAGRSGRNSSKYSGLRNQGCTCYMNSVLQQLFMMPELRSSLCAAPLPTSVRSTSGVVSAKGAALVGKKVAMQWENGVTYDAMVEAYDETTGMHTIRYCPVQVATVSGGNNHPQIHPEDIARLPPGLPDELLLSEGRPGKETGVFSIVKTAIDTSPGAEQPNSGSKTIQVEESEDEINSRHLLEEVQRTFIHLDEGSRGRCFDPRALVEACACLKLEFDVWQQNDASEFATKLLDRLEISLKRWAPDHFRYLDHTFGLKQTKQKICKECGLKSNRQEKLLSVDCQIRGKSDIHEALASMTEVEIMDGNNQVFCDRCKKNTDTVLKTAISSLPNMLILSLKRFDLDYNTFETVKLNSRCAFGQTLNLKRYTLEAQEAQEQSNEDEDAEPMETDHVGHSDDEDNNNDDGERSKRKPSPLDRQGSPKELPVEDYEYHLAGVLVHAGVAQGGHYYSFIKDRSPESQGKWFRFDDEDVTPFDPASIESECFGGKVKKETKWPNGQVQTVETEQYANALMLFYEKVRKTEVPPEEEDGNDGGGSGGEEKSTEGGGDDVDLGDGSAMPRPKQEDEDSERPTVHSEDVKGTAEMSQEETKARKKTSPSIPEDLSMSSGFDVFEPDVQRSNTTHRWQTLLFDNEFQMFLKALLGLCRMKSNDDSRMVVSPGSSPREAGTIQTWRSTVVDMLLLFVFDVLLYSSERVNLAEWVTMLNETLQKDRTSAIGFVRQLAERTCTVSSNWLRTYLLDCPDANAREAAVVIFTNAIASSLLEQAQVQALEGWTNAWTKQMGLLPRPFKDVPSGLLDDLSVFEDLSVTNNAKCSTVGIVLSHLNKLLDAMPRNWRQHADIGQLIRNLVETESTNARNGMKRALIASQMPARLICYIARSNVPGPLSTAFPGASVAIEVAESQMRVEQNPTVHLVALGGGGGGGAGHVMGGSDIGYRGGGMPTEQVHMFESLCAMMDAPGSLQAPIVEETKNGRQRNDLSEPAKRALAELYKEFCAPDAPGMGRKEIDEYLYHCSVDSATIPPQKINDIMAKHPVVDENNETVLGYLSLEGFFAYYKDACATNEAMVRSDLNRFGFRPDLTRRPRETYAVDVSDHEQWRSTIESVAHDVALHFKNGRPSLGTLAEVGLTTFHLYTPAVIANEGISEVLIASAAYGRKCEQLIIETLGMLFNAPAVWSGGEIVNAATTVLRMLVAIPDDKQSGRIDLIMNCTERGSLHVDGDIGLLPAARIFYDARPGQHYANEYSHAYERYIAILKELMTIEASRTWMEGNRDLWEWMERDLVDQYPQQHSSAYVRADYNHRDMDTDGVIDGRQHRRHQPHHPSDSDMPGTNESEEEDDEDSQYDDPDAFRDAPAYVIVEGAGIEEVDGRYARDGTFERVPKYSREGEYSSESCVFSLFQCNVSNNTKHWFISIVPKNGQPGTTSDIDFYSVPVTSDCQDFPPHTGWKPAQGDTGEVPTVRYPDQ